MHPVTLTWAGGENDFLLRLGELRALQDRCDAGPEWILQRLRTGQWKVDDVVSTIRLGLEGGGMDKEAARKLTLHHVEDQPLTLNVLTAQLVLAASLYDRGDDPVGEAQAGAETTPPLSPEESGAFPDSTAPGS